MYGAIGSHGHDATWAAHGKRSAEPRGYLWVQDRASGDPRVTLINVNSDDILFI